jgi:hypothetical protein
MKRHLRSTVVLALAGLLLSVGTNYASAQGFSFGGSNNQNDQDQDNNQSNRNDDDDDNRGNDSNRQGGRRSSSRNQSSNDTTEQIQQFFPGVQGGTNLNKQNNSNQQNQGNNQYRRSNQQGNFPGNQQGQNWQQGNQNNITIGGWNSGKWQGSRKVDNWTKQFGGNQQPFSSQWYKDHPKAWKYDNNNNNSNIWVGGSLPGLYGWLGWGNVPQQYRNYYGNNVPQFNRSHYGEWYPLGVFTLMAGPGDPGTRMVQLAVDQHGHIAGNYYDMITGSNYSVSGDIRQQGQRATWSLNKNQFVRFRAPVYQLLQPYGTVTVSLPGGDQQWQFVRLEN